MVDTKTGRVCKIISQSEMVTQVRVGKMASFENLMASIHSKIYKNVVEHQQAEPLFIQTPRTHKMGLCDVFCVDGKKQKAHVAFEGECPGGLGL